MKSPAEGSIMEIQWTVENADNDLTSFINEAPDHVFFKRFPSWKGTRSNFKYEHYKTTLHERRFQNLKRKGFIDADQPILSARNIRRIYKRGLSKIEEDRAAARAKRLSEQSTDSTRLDCLRCIMINRGEIFISENLICSCKIQVCFEKSENDEDMLTPSVESIDDADYVQTLVLSTTLMNDGQTPNIQEDLPPERLIKQRQITETQTFSKKTTHTCIKTDTRLKGKKTIKLKQTEKGKTVEGNFLIYAPSGFGKTSLQHILVRRGMLVGDTDDMPEINITQLKAKLEETSVLTNRMDLANAYDEKKILFLPKTAVALKRSNFSLTDQDYQYWYDQHKNMTRNQSTIICHVEKTHLSQWFEVEQSLTNYKSLKGLEEIEERIDHLSLEKPIAWDRWTTGPIR